MLSMRRRQVFFASLLSLTAIDCSPAVLRAQSPDAAASASKSRTIQSMGIKALVTSVTKSGNGFAVQMEIENQRKDTIYITPVTSRFAGGGNTALAASGKQFMIANGGQGFVGMDACTNSSQGFAVSVSTCVKTLQIENMTAIEPSSRAVLGVSFDGPGDPGAYASFSLKFIVREAAGSHLNTLGSKSEKSEDAGPPSVVSLSFPLLAFSD